MIPRYTRPEMGQIWSDENKYSVWLQIEILACEAQAKLGIVPKEALKIIKKKAKFDIKRIEEIEETTKHDIIAFLTNIEEYVGEPSRWIHLGMTSSDILDTTFSIQCRQAAVLILVGLEKLIGILARRANEFKYTVCVGRSHGVHAEATTFGLKLALWFEEMNRNYDRLVTATEDISVGKLSGAVGTYEHISPEVEAYVCKKLDLIPAPVSTQVIQRDIYANFISVLAITASSLEKIATEIRLLQQTELLEAEEYFSIGQKGSSAMPHKRNPIASENICGQARLLRSYVSATIENNALWHERDISHSSVERVIFPDATISLDYILNRTINLIDKLIVYPDKMLSNLNLTLGLIHSQKVLIELAKMGIKRQEAYVIVQRNAMKTWSEKRPFLEILLEDNELLNHISKEELEHLFSYENIFRSVDFIFKRIGLDV